MVRNEIRWFIPSLTSWSHDGAAGEPLLESIRVLIAGVPSLMREIVRNAVGPHTDVITQADAGDLVRAVDESKAHVLVISADDLELPRAWEEVMRAYPDVVLIGLASRGRGALICKVMEEVSGEWLVEGVRSRSRGL